jgi:hypothetical protein
MPGSQRISLTPWIHIFDGIFRSAPATASAGIPFTLQPSPCLVPAGGISLSSCAPQIYAHRSGSRLTGCDIPLTCCDTGHCGVNQSARRWPRHQRGCCSPHTAGRLLPLAFLASSAARDSVRRHPGFAPAPPSNEPSQTIPEIMTSDSMRVALAVVIAAKLSRGPGECRVRLVGSPRIPAGGLHGGVLPPRERPAKPHPTARDWGRRAAPLLTLTRLELAYAAA